MDEADRLFIHERLNDLRADESLDQKKETQVWKQIRARSAAFVRSSAVQKIAVDLVTAAVRHDLGW